MRTLYLIRHAVPENDDRSFRVSAFQRDMHGAEDHDLSPRGRGQAKDLGGVVRGLGVEQIYSSTMRRARQTADIAALEAGCARGSAIADLIEIRPGTPERPALSVRFATRLLGIPFFRRLLGRRLGPLLGLYHLNAWMRGQSLNGEPLEHAAERLERGLSAVEASARETETETVAVVCHGFVIIWLAHRFTGSWRFFFPPRMDNCSVTRFDKTPAGEWQLRYFARVG